MSNTIAITSIIVSGILGLAGLASPIWVRRQDRQHETAVKKREREVERVEMVRVHRIEVYAGMMRILQSPKEFNREPMATLIKDTGVQARLWGSNEVIDLFMAWVELMPSGYGPQKNDAQDAIILAAANLARDRMADELQGRVASL